jgi:hypothetical protein
VTETLAEAIEIGSSLASYITLVSFINDKGYIPTTGRFLVSYKKILLDALSNMKVFKLGTL